MVCADLVYVHLRSYHAPVRAVQRGRLLLGTRVFHLPPHARQSPGVSLQNRVCTVVEKESCGLEPSPRTCKMQRGPVVPWKVRSHSRGTLGKSE
jgi:hypothetical protein